MKKSKEIIKKTLLLIFILLAFLVLLESNLFYPLRNFVSTIIPFFHGKRALFSNILIGILGSSIVLIFGELITYHYEKQKLHVDILKLYQDWNTNIIHLTLTPLTDFKDLMRLATNIEKYSKRVDSTYNSYLPYFRGGTYFQLLRTLYKYTNTITEYSESITAQTNERAALLYSIEQYNIQKTSTTDVNTIASIDQIISQLQSLLDTLNTLDIIEDDAIQEINASRKSITEISTKADSLWLLNKLQGLNLKDTQSELHKTLKETRKEYKAFKRRVFLIKLKEFTPSALLNRYKIKKLLKKYDTSKEAHNK